MSVDYDHDETPQIHWAFCSPIQRDARSHWGILTVRQFDYDFDVTPAS